MSCDLDLVRRALGLLSASGASCWIFGGWAEELRGLCPARPHKDLDLLCVAPSFAAVERLLGGGRVDEIHRKRFPHKRAFVLDGVMVELFLVERDSRGLFTNFWSRCRHDWPVDVIGGLVSELPVASTTALTSYRSAHSRLHLPSDETGQLSVGSERRR